jgi:hypothetical protein
VGFFQKQRRMGKIILKEREIGGGGSFLMKMETGLD